MSKICCIVGCMTKHPLNIENRRTLFKVPKNKEEIWLKEISTHLRQGKSCRKQLYICDLHFNKEDVSRNFLTVLNDGTVHTMPRRLFRLKPGSVPCIFDGNYEDLIEITEMKPFEIKSEIFNDIEYPSIQNPTIDRSVSDEGQNRIKMEYDITTLHNDLQQALICENMHKNWEVFKRPLGLFMYYYGDNQLCPTKSILIKDDMTTEIRLQTKIISLHKSEKITCSEDIFRLMTKVSEIYPCQGVDDDSPCPNEFIESFAKTASDRCLACRVQRKRKYDRERRNRKDEVLRLEENTKLIKYLKQKCSFLRKSLTAANEKMENMEFPSP